jgi:hypothetical protein
MTIKLHTFLTSSLDEGQRLASRILYNSLDETQASKYLEFSRGYRPNNITMH